MKSLATLLTLLVLLAVAPSVLSATSPAGPRPAATPAAPEPAPAASSGHIYHFEYLRARPGRSGDYDHFVKTIFKPMLEEMVRRGIWLRYTFMTVPYAGPAPCADYTHVFVAELPNFAALDREAPAWSEIQKKHHPDEKERHQLFEVALQQIREMVREEILKDFEWK